MGTGMENYSIKFCSKYIHEDYIYKREKGRRGVEGPVGRSIMRRMLRSVATIAKITLVCLNIWVLAVVLVISLGHWRVFETVDSSTMYDNSHLMMMRELKEDTDRKLTIMAQSVTNISEVESYFVPANADTIFNMDIDKEDEPGGGEEAAKKSKPAPAASSAKKSGAPSKTVVKEIAPPSKTVVKEVAPPVANPQPPAPLKPKAETSDQSRLKTMAHWCHQQHTQKIPYEKIPALRLRNIVYDEKHKFLFCQVPGAAQIDWRKIMLITTKVVNVSSPAAISGGDVFGKYAKSLKRLMDVSDASKRAGILSSFFKVIFVRDPLERLLEIYKTKFKAAGGKFFHQVYGSPIIQKYRKGASEADIKSGSSVQFSEFVQYIVDGERDGKVVFNEHWLQYYKQCFPCLVDYNFVGTFENADADARAVLQNIKVDKEVKPPLINSKQRVKEKELVAAYKTVDVQTLKKLYNVYVADYTLFGYKCPDFLHKLLEKDVGFTDY